MAEQSKHKAKSFQFDKRQISVYALVAWFFLSAAYMLSGSIASLLSGLTSAPTTAPNNTGPSGSPATGTNQAAFLALEKSVIPDQGFTLNAKWGTAIKQLVASGALNVSFLNKSLAQSSQPITPIEHEILNGTYEGNITMNQSNSVFTLYVLWALGINNNNTILNNGPIMHYGGNPNNLASTGGYGPLGTLQLGRLNIISLTQEQQAIANYTAQNTYRPCCNNPTFFPDCNHGAAALGLIELMASQGASMQGIFAAVEDFSVLQFPQQYVYAAAYLAAKNISWRSADPQTVMGYNYSSATGASEIAQYLQANRLLPPQTSGGSSCGS